MLIPSYLQFPIVSPTYVSSHKQINTPINNTCVLRVFQNILNLTFLLVKETNLLFYILRGKQQTYCNLFSFFKEARSIISSSFFQLNILIVFSITYFGYTAFIYLVLILFVSLSKSETILLALCRSTVVAFLLHLKRTFESQCTGSFITLW